MSTRSERVTFEVFRAADRYALTALYIESQAASYRRHPGSGAALPDPTLFADATIILARTHDGVAVGGMRMHAHVPGVALPVEKALGHLCPIAPAIADADGPLVELCGTFVNSGFRGTDLGAALTAVSVAAVRASGARRIVACAHQHVLDLYLRFGAEVDQDLGFHPYPDDRYRTCVIWSDPFVAGREQRAVDACTAMLERDARIEASIARSPDADTLPLHDRLVGRDEPSVVPRARTFAGARVP